MFIARLNGCIQAADVVARVEQQLGEQNRGAAIAAVARCLCSLRVPGPNLYGRSIEITFDHIAGSLFVDYGTKELRDQWTAGSHTLMTSAGCEACSEKLRSTGCVEPGGVGWF
eukprot:SAG31_NODE_861_length_11418_cov_5.107430_3_plen_113_part_00